MSKLATPTLDKIIAVRDESQSIGNFLEWLTGRFELAQYHNHSPECFDDDETQTCGRGGHQFYPAHIPIEKLLAEYFDIDLHQADRERMAILEALQND